MPQAESEPKWSDRNVKREISSQWTYRETSRFSRR